MDKDKRFQLVKNFLNSETVSCYRISKDTGISNAALSRYKSGIDSNPNELTLRTLELYVVDLFKGSPAKDLVICDCGSKTRYHLGGNRIMCTKCEKITSLQD